jgi:hypothetical protein
MSLFPGGRELIGGSFQYSVSDAAIANSVVAQIETEMDGLLTAVKGAGLPDTGKEDRRILFAAIARGILIYLQAQQTGNVLAQTAPTPVQVTFKVDPDKF